MISFQETECIKLNDLIFSIYSISDFDKMRLSVMEQLRDMIYFDKADFYLSGVDGVRLENPVAVDVKPEVLRRYDEYYEQKDYIKWVFSSSKSFAYRETDLIVDEIRMETEFFKEFLIPWGIYYSMGLSICESGIFLGTINFFREKKSGDFKKHDLRIMELLSKHLSYRLFLERRSKKRFDFLNSQDARGLTVREKEIVALVASGKSNNDISQSENISIFTVKRHVYNIFKKLGIKSRTQLVQKFFG